LHPLFVHFPIAFLVGAVLAQFTVVIFPKNIQLKWFTFSLLLAGCIGALIAIQTAVHVSGAADFEAIEIFETHRFYGLLTFWFSLAAAILRFVTIKWLTKKRWLEIIVTAAIIATAAFVTIAGHQGAQMVYVYGVGPKGNGVMNK
jgi:uncharacterized membrane protein